MREKKAAAWVRIMLKITFAILFLSFIFSLISDFTNPVGGWVDDKYDRIAFGLLFFSFGFALIGVLTAFLNIYLYSGWQKKNVLFLILFIILSLFHFLYFFFDIMWGFDR